MVTVEDGSLVERKDSAEMDCGYKAWRTKYVVNFLLAAEVCRRNLCDVVAAIMDVK